MKKLHHLLKPLVTGSLVAVLLVSTPMVGFANHDNGRGGYGAKAKVEQRSSAQINKNSNSSFWARIFGGLFGNRAKAATNSNVNMSPRISGITAPTVLKTGAEGTWTVKASDPKNGSLSYAVDWGDKAEMGTMALESSFVQTSTFTHTYSKPGTYTITFTVKNDAGLSAKTTTTVRVTGRPMADAPVISNVSATSTRPRQAVVTWNTDVRADSHLWYSTESPVDTDMDAPDGHISRSGKVKNHRIVLNGLEPGTKYYVVVGSHNEGGETLSAETSFTTKARVDKNAPVIKSLEGPSLATVGEEITVTVKASDPKNDSLTYSADWGDEPAMTSTALMARPDEPFVQTSTFTHVYSDAGNYTATFTVQNSLGKKVSSSINIKVAAAPDNGEDTTAPVIAPHDDIKVEATSQAGAVVTYSSPEVTDNKDAATTATCSPASGSTFPIGETKVLCNHTDAAGNAAVETYFMVTVTPESKTE